MAMRLPKKPFRRQKAGPCIDPEVQIVGFLLSDDCSAGQQALGLFDRRGGKDASELFFTLLFHLLHHFLFGVFLLVSLLFHLLGFGHLALLTPS
jgi:hypothetical protein